MIRVKVWYVKLSFSLVAFVALAVAMPTVTTAQETEIEIAQKKIDELLQKAEKLRKAGAADKAERLRKQAAASKARLDKASGQSSRKIPQGQLEEIVQGLKAGAASLHALGRTKEAHRLENLAAEVQAQASSADKADAAESERAMALKQLGIMRVARKGLAEAEKDDAADSLQQAIRALEVALEGRRDDEAKKIRESAPSRGQQIELLMFAARQLREADQEEQARAVANLSEQWLKRFRARQAKEQSGERGRSKQRE